MRTIDTTTSNGKRVTVDVDAHGSHPRVTLTVDGEYNGSSDHACPLKTPVVLNGKTYTHYIGDLALTATEAATIDAECDRLRATDPACVLRDLREQRATLQDKYRGLRDADSDRRERAWDRGDEAGGVADEDEAVEVARQAVLAFDAAHPEVK